MHAPAFNTQRNLFVTVLSANSFLLPKQQLQNNEVTHSHKYQWESNTGRPREYITWTTDSVHNSHWTTDIKCDNTHRSRQRYDCASAGVHCWIQYQLRMNFLTSHCVLAQQRTQWPAGLTSGQMFRTPVHSRRQHQTTYSQKKLILQRFSSRTTTKTSGKQINSGSQQLLLLQLLHPFYSSLDFVRDYPDELVSEPIWILWKQESVSSSGISWDICESAPRPRQITMPGSQEKWQIKLRRKCTSQG